MPIYAYKCASCGFAKDVLQKMSDAPLSQCPTCGQPTFKKQLTAAGFQLKGSGWYATDFKGGGASAPAVGGESGAGQESGKEGKADGKADDKSSGKTEGKAEAKSSEGKSESKKADAPAAKKADSAPTPKSGD